MFPRGGLLLCSQREFDRYLYRVSDRVFKRVWKRIWETPWGGDRTPIMEYLPGRKQYEYMKAGPCPLCGGNCTGVVKREIEEDIFGRKWRFSHNP
jgi:glucose dehydrogenase